MKYLHKTFLISMLLLISCKKDENKVVTKKEAKVITTIDSTSEFSNTIDGKTTKAKKKIQKHEYIYQAFDGTEANITFTTGTNEGNFILIERNKLKIELPQKETFTKGAIYEKDGIKAEVKGDQLTITQSGQIFELKRKK